MTGCAGCRVVALDGRTFRVDVWAGYYRELVTAPLDTFEPGEPRAWLEGRKVARYAALYRGGSLFPPVAALGFTDDHGRLTVPDGNHRPAAARLAGAPELHAWVTPYVPFEGYGETRRWRPARLSDTGVGRQLAVTLDLEWCPRCGHFLPVLRSTASLAVAGQARELRARR
jgi:hypothetical protein